MPRAGRWLEEAGGSRGDGSNDVQDLSTMGHVVMVGSPYHTMLQEYFGDSALGHQGYSPGIYYTHTEGARCLGFRNLQMTASHLK